MPTVTSSYPDLLTVPQAAALIGIHPESLYRLIREDKFAPAIHIGGMVRVSRPRLEKFLHGDGEAV